MSDKPTIHEALSAVMGDVQAVGKTGRNTQQNYNFRGIDAVVNAVGPALREHGVIVLPRLLRHAAEQYQTSRGAQMKCVTVEVEFTFVGPDGSTLVCSVAGESADSGDKATPKAHSVAYRTALLQALCIPTDEPDPDAHSHERAAPVATITAEQVERVRKACATQDARTLWMGRFGCKPAQLPADRWAEAEDWISDLEALS